MRATPPPCRGLTPRAQTARATAHTWLRSSGGYASAPPRMCGSCQCGCWTAPARGWSARWWRASTPCVPRPGAPRWCCCRCSAAARPAWTWRCRACWTMASRSSTRRATSWATRASTAPRACGAPSPSAPPTGATACLSSPAPDPAWTCLPRGRTSWRRTAPTTLPPGRCPAPRRRPPWWRRPQPCTWSATRRRRRRRCSARWCWQARTAGCAASRRAPPTCCSTPPPWRMTLPATRCASVRVPSRSSAASWRSATPSS
mmetsp:Transcript_41242/g.103626  ORF Transcript_41242/g.103626 Transcript_41242/m.103626 type:complete len:259 (+) Transcript_41242:57-833(+)